MIEENTVTLTVNKSTIEITAKPKSNADHFYTKMGNDLPKPYSAEYSATQNDCIITIMGTLNDLQVTADLLHSYSLISDKGYDFLMATLDPDRKKPETKPEPKSEKKLGFFGSHTKKKAPSDNPPHSNHPDASKEKPRRASAGLAQDTIPGNKKG